MIPRNLRHLRLFLDVAGSGSVTVAAGRGAVSQPAATQALRKLERETGGPLFDRTRQGLFPNARGAALAARAGRALGRLDPALAEVSPRLTRTATAAQLLALTAAAETENFTLAARRLGRAQPTIHRAVAELEREAGRPLFERTSHGIVATRACRALTRAAHLAFAELDQAAADLAELDGGAAAGPVVIAALPLSRSVLLPGALAAYAEARPGQPVRVIEGPYDQLLAALRSGRADLMLGALRIPAPIDDVAQERLFDDRVAVIAAPDHPLAGRAGLTRQELRGWPWLAPSPNTPQRDRFDAFFEPVGPPERVLETGSILMMREVLRRGPHLGWISRALAGAEAAHGLVTILDAPLDDPGRPIGLTTRAGWRPTAAQAELVETIRATAKAEMG